MARHSAGLGWPSFGEPGGELGRLEKTGANRYNENDGVSALEHELAFGIVICFQVVRPASPGPPAGWATKAGILGHSAIADAVPVS